MTFLVSKRLLAKCRRNVKRVDHAFNVVTTPITFCELSFDDLPDQIPYRDVVSSMMSYALDTFQIFRMYPMHMTAFLLIRILWSLL